MGRYRDAEEESLTALHGIQFSEGVLIARLIFCGAVFLLIFLRWRRLRIASQFGPVYVLRFADPARQAEARGFASDVAIAALEKEAADRLISIYRSHPQGLDRWKASKELEAVQSIGRSLDEHGGMAAMLRVHQEFSSRCGVRGAPRNLEFMWDGIGNWRG
jgi:hypothetical protein